MKTVSTSVGFQDPLGNLVANGKLILDLSQPAEITSGGGLLAPTRIVFQLTALAKITPTNMWFNDELTPSGTSYHSILIDSNQNEIADFGQWVIAGASADLSTMVPTSGGASAAGAVLLNPVAQQNINGQTLNLEGAALGFSAAASTTADAFVNRGGAGIVDIGTTTTNASGTLVAGTIQVITLNASLFAAADGTAGAPSFSFQSTTDRGLFNDTGFGGLGLASGGATKAYVHNAGITIGPNVLGAASSITGAPDSGISRTGAATFAVGNGTPANATGTLNAAAYQVGGTGMTGSGGGIVRATAPTISAPVLTGTGTFFGQSISAYRVQDFTGLTSQAPNAVEGQQWTVTLTWSSPFADASFFVFGQIQNSTAGTPIVMAASAASASTVLVTFAQASAVQSTVTEVLLFGIHF